VLPAVRSTSAAPAVATRRAGIASSVRDDSHADRSPCRHVDANRDFFGKARTNNSAIGRSVRRLLAS
jgi:hypothetical protein